MQALEEDLLSEINDGQNVVVKDEDLEVGNQGVTYSYLEQRLI